MQSRKNKVSSLCRSYSCGNSFGASHLADHNDIDILTEDGLERNIKILSINTYFTLVDHRPLWFKEVFYRLFNGDYMFCPLGIYEVYHSCHSSRFALSNWTNNQKEPLFLASKSLK